MPTRKTIRNNFPLFILDRPTGLPILRTGEGVGNRPTGLSTDVRVCTGVALRGSVTSNSVFKIANLWSSNSTSGYFILQMCAKTYLQECSLQCLQQRRTGHDVSFHH